MCVVVTLLLKKTIIIKSFSPSVHILSQLKFYKITKKIPLKNTGTNMWTYLKILSFLHKEIKNTINLCSLSEPITHILDTTSLHLIGYFIIIRHSGTAIKKKSEELQSPSYFIGLNSVTIFFLMQN